MTLDNKTLLKVAAPLLCLSISHAAQAISVGTYNMHNHPDGSAADPLYGLRLDGLLTGNTNEIYTFDFDHTSSAMTLTYDGSSVVIDGVAYGGQDAGAAGYVAGTTAIWNIHFEYHVGLSQPGTDGGLSDVFVDADFANFGSLSSGLGSFELTDKSDNSGLSFRLGDINGAGHRGYDGISGFGWLRHGDDCTSETPSCANIPYSDWLFTVTPVPVPAAFWLFGSAILGLVGVKRRKP